MFFLYVMGFGADLRPPGQRLAVCRQRYSEGFLTRQRMALAPTSALERSIRQQCMLHVACHHSGACIWLVLIYNINMHVPQDIGWTSIRRVYLLTCM